MRVKYLAQEHNTMTRPGLDPESSALTTRPPLLLMKNMIKMQNHVYNDTIK